VHNLEAVLVPVTGQVHSNVTRQVVNYWILTYLLTYSLHGVWH